MWYVYCFIRREYKSRRGPYNQDQAIKIKSHVLMYGGFTEAIMVWEVDDAKGKAIQERQQGSGR